jgi:hypothetical protein
VRRGGAVLELPWKGRWHLGVNAAVVHILGLRAGGPSPRQPACVPLLNSLGDGQDVDERASRPR